MLWRRLCTTLPLPMMSTPRSRRNCSCRAKSKCQSSGLVAVEAELEHGHVGIGKQVVQHRPGAVVEAPFVGAVYVGHLGHQLAGQRGGAGRRVLHIEQRLREAAEVVDGARPLLEGDEGAAREPVRRHHQHGRGRLAPTQVFAQPGAAAR